MKKIRNLALGICLLAAFSFKVTAQDQIKFTWSGTSFQIQATANKKFTVDWGDSSEIQNWTGNGDWQACVHTYSVAKEYNVVISAKDIDCRFISFSCAGLYGSMKYLDVSEATALSYLNCESNYLLTGLNLSNCSALTYLKCSGNLLTELNLSDCTSLNTLNCSWNLLTELDLSGCLNLTELDCGTNQITELNLSPCPNLKFLYCNNNKLTELDLSSCSGLERLGCGINQLTELNLSNCPNLIGLSCFSNQLTELDLSPCPDLDFFSGNEQQISLTLHNNGENLYVHTISLNEPWFSNGEIDYIGGKITSTNTTATTTDFTVKTWHSHPNYKLSGTITFEYEGVGIGENTIAPNITVYPNPTKGVLRIESGDLRVEKVEILDITGRTVLTSHETMINISQFSTGAYFVKLKTDKGELTKKVIKE
jgi:hypothetical protein